MCKRLLMVLLCLALASCAAIEQNPGREGHGYGALGGAATGAAIGAIVGGGKGAGTGAAIGRSSARSAAG